MVIPMKNNRTQFWSNLFRDRWLIILCLLLAFLTWHGVRRNIGNEIPISDVAVELQVPEGWAVWDKSLSRVNVLFRGSREDMLYLNNDQLKVVIPIDTPIADEEISIKISDSFLRNPTDSKVVRFNPPEIVVRLDQESVKLLPVKASIAEETLPSGIEVTRVTCTPAAVQVSGAKKILDGMTSIHTEKLRLRDRQTTFRESVQLALPEGSRIRAEPTWISVEVQLSVQSDVKVFEAIPIHILSPPGEDRLITVAPATIDITLQGRPQLLERLSSKELFAFVKSADLPEYAGYDVPVDIRLPAGLSLTAKPPVVHVEIRKP
jgi:YbbR domain-containing protein